MRAFSEFFDPPGDDESCENLNSSREGRNFVEDDAKVITYVPLRDLEFYKRSLIVTWIIIAVSLMGWMSMGLVSKVIRETTHFVHSTATT